MRNHRSEHWANLNLQDGQKNVRKELPVRQEPKWSLTFMEAVVGLTAICVIVVAFGSML